MDARRAMRLIFCLHVLSILLAGCQTTPNQGSIGRVQVLDVPAQRQALHAHQQVREELEVFEAEIRQKQLVHVTCVIPDPGAYNGERQWNRLVILPKRGMVSEGDTINLQVMPDGPLKDQVFVFNARLQDPPAEAFYEYVVNGSKTVFRDLKCDIGADGLPLRVKVLRPIPVFELEYAKAERARHRQFADSDFTAGRVGIGSCSLRDTLGEVYYQPIWLFRIPGGIPVNIGDVVELLLGEAESGPGVGNVSQMVSVLGRGKDFPGDGHAAIYCN
jgi:hypothetical protein